MKKAFLAFTLAIIAVAAHAQNMFDYSDLSSGLFAQKSVSGVRSMNDGEHYTAVREGRIEKYSYKSGDISEVLFDSKNVEGFGERFSTYELSADEKKILLSKNRRPIYRRSATADYYIYDIAGKTIRKLTEAGGEQEAAFSPDGSRVAFVRTNNIYYVDLSDYSLHAVTGDGLFNNIINGHTDWVYEEEFGFTRAFEFSPDGQEIAYLRFDESEVREYTMIYFRNRLYPEPYKFKYPLAGEKNSVVTLYVYDIRSGNTTQVDTGTETDQYIPRIGWTPQGELFFYRTNRLQNHFELLTADNTGISRVVFEEKDKRYIERLDNETVTFLPKRRIMVKSERSGYMHLYVHDLDKGTVVDTVTRGNWDVTKLVDVAGDRVYYISAEESPLRRNLYSVRLNGKSKTRLTEGEGTYAVAPSRGFRYFISYFSNTGTPLVVSLHNSSGKVLRVLEDNAALRNTIVQRRLPKKEFFTFTTIYGSKLNGYIVKPTDFDPSKKYPVMMTQYSGPGSQSVADSWSIGWEDVLVQEGYIVACVDGRGTGARGADFKKCTYGNLGALETQDQIEAAKYLATLTYIDPERIGIYGWSYGGFMALNCILKGADIFKMAIAVAPVTSWRYYDSIYTEIYNGLPQDNPHGYDDNSPINFAGNLKGKLLICHGTGDDNVHVRNTYMMADALVRAEKQFDLMLYPDDNHSMVPGGRNHIRQYMVDYTLRNL